MNSAASVSNQLKAAQTAEGELSAGADSSRDLRTVNPTGSQRVPDRFLMGPNKFPACSQKISGMFLMGFWQVPNMFLMDFPWFSIFNVPQTRPAAWVRLYY